MESHGRKQHLAEYQILRIQNGEAFDWPRLELDSGLDESVLIQETFL